MKRVSYIFVSTCALTIACLCSAANAGSPAFASKQIRDDLPALPPIAFTRFCLHYTDDCLVHGSENSVKPVYLSESRLKDLLEVNRDVNHAIAPKIDEGGVLSERWRLWPKAGACHDFAVTKRHELLARGWPSSVLLLAEVIVPWGEHHLVLVVRTNEGDLVLDNLAEHIQLWSDTAYRWVRIQSSTNPNFWSTVAPLVGYRLVSGSHTDISSLSPLAATIMH
jgi:predicted transglutaminase-like cysteine proteinase